VEFRLGIDNKNNQHRNVAQHCQICHHIIDRRRPKHFRHHYLIRGEKPEYKIVAVQSQRVKHIGGKQKMVLFKVFQHIQAAVIMISEIPPHP
jgi:exoribonuclease II